MPLGRVIGREDPGIVARGPEVVVDHVEH
jgi:hypothetical protein